MPNTNMIQLSTYQDDLMVVNEQPRRFLVRSRVVFMSKSQGLILHICTPDLMSEGRIK